jgi:hypothetical protein
VEAVLYQCILSMLARHRILWHFINLTMNCFSLAMTNKLVVIMKSLKVPNIKKILLYEMKLLVRNYSCLQNPWLGGYSSQIPVLCPQPNLLNPPPKQNSWISHCGEPSGYADNLDNWIFFLNRLHQQFEIRLLLFKVCTCL